MSLKNWTGIYEIVNIITGNQYIGGTVDGGRRKGEHFRDLRKGNHFNMRLQMDFNKYGEEAFKFNLIQPVLREHLKEVEQTYLDEEKPYYNLSKQARGIVLEDHPKKEEIAENKSRAMKKWFSTLTPEQRKEIYGRPGESSIHWKGGKPHCQSCGKVVDYGHQHCQNCRPYPSGKDSPFHGKKHSEETRKRIGEARKVLVIVNKCEYPSVSEASKALGISRSTVSRRCHSKSEKFKDYKCKQS